MSVKKPFTVSIPEWEDDIIEAMELRVSPSKGYGSGHARSKWVHQALRDYVSLVNRNHTTFTRRIWLEVTTFLVEEDLLDCGNFSHIRNRLSENHKRYPVEGSFLQQALAGLVIGGDAALAHILDTCRMLANPNIDNEVVFDHLNLED